MLYSQFIQAVTNWQEIKIDPETGEWTSHRPSHIQNLESRNVYYNRVAQQIILLFDALERKPLILKEKKEGKRIGKKQCIQFESCIKIANEVLIRTRISSLNLIRLKQRIFALQHRINYALSDNLEGKKDLPPSTSSTSTPALVSQFKKEARRWKQTQPFFRGRSNCIDDREEEQLKILCDHQDIAELMLLDQTLREKFFKWSLLHQNDAKVFIQYPAITNILTQSFLSNVIGRLGSDDLQIKQRPRKKGLGKEQVLTLPFENLLQPREGKTRREISLLRGSMKTFRLGNWRVSIEDITKDSSEQNSKTPQIVYTPGEGFQNFNRQTYTYYDDEQKENIPIDLNKAKWWEQIPPIKITQEKAAQIFNTDPNHLAGDGAVVIAATRESPNRSLTSTHGFQVVVINDPNNPSKCKLYAWGKYIDPTEWPKTRMGRVKIIGSTKKGIFCVHDYNFCYMQREHCYLPVNVNKTDIEKYIDYFKPDIQAAIEGDLIFQTGGDNCAFDTEKRIDSVFGDRLPKLNLFSVPIIDTAPPAPLSFIFRVIKSMVPKPFEDKALRGVLKPFQPGRKMWTKGGKICHSLKKSLFWESLNCYLPSMLFERVQNKKLQCYYKLELNHVVSKEEQDESYTIKIGLITQMST